MITNISLSRKKMKRIIGRKEEAYISPSIQIKLNHQSKCHQQSP